MAFENLAFENQEIMKFIETKNVTWFKTLDVMIKFS